SRSWAIVAEKTFTPLKRFWGLSASAISIQPVFGVYGCGGRGGRGARGGRGGLVGLGVLDWSSPGRCVDSAHSAGALVAMGGRGRAAISSFTSTSVKM